MPVLPTGDQGADDAEFPPAHGNGLDEARGVQLDVPREVRVEAGRQSLGGPRLCMGCLRGGLQQEEARDVVVIVVEEDAVRHVDPQLPPMGFGERGQDGEVERGLVAAYDGVTTQLLLDRDLAGARVWLGQLLTALLTDGSTRH